MVEVRDAAGHSEPARILERRRLVPAALSRSFLIVHGLEGSGPEHWQSWLAGRLRERGETVSYPGLPDPFDPQPEEWLSVLRHELAAMNGERIVLCHSLACLLWLLHARAGAAGSADRVLLVAPPCLWEVPAVLRFRADGTTADDVHRAAGVTRMVCAADGDPYCPAGALEVYGDLGIDADVIPRGGHLNTDAGYGSWPALEAWALGEREDVEAR